jgi:hypothetical protein
MRKLFPVRLPATVFRAARAHRKDGINRWKNAEGGIMKKVLTVFALACVTMTWAAPVSGSEAEVISIAGIRRDSKADIDSARERYLNKRVVIKGVVVSTGMSMYMTPTVLLADQGEEALCVLPYVGIGLLERKAQLSDYKEGQAVTMSGRIHAMSIERLVLKECKTED